MNSEAYDRIIDRYLNGQMTPSEEQDFFQLLKLDDDLRATFDAEKLIGETTRRDVEMIGGAPAESYTHFLAALATVGAAAGTVAASEASAATATGAGSTTASTATATGSSFFGGLMTGGLVKGVIAAIGIAAVGTGLYVASPFGSTDKGAKTTPSAIERTIDNDRTPASAAPEQTSEDRSAASTAVPQQSVPEAAQQQLVQETPVLGEPAASGNVGAPALMNRKTEQPVSPVSPAQTNARNQQRSTQVPGWEDEAADQPMKIIVSDSVRSTVKVDKPR